jgi:hypothetical protein
VANGGDGLRIYDVANPASPINVGYVPDYNEGFGDAIRVAVSGHYAYLANTQDGLRIYDVSNPAIPINVGYINNGGYTIGVAAAGKYAYVVNVIDYPSGLRIYDMSNPVAPINVGHASADGTTSGVVVSGNYAYVLSGTRGLRIYSVLPQLSINLATNRVRLSWPAPASFVVQQNPDLNTTNWVSLTNGPVSVGSQSEVVIPPPAGKMFYRLMSQ